jgi:hypothetical protein
MTMRFVFSFLVVFALGAQAFLVAVSPAVRRPAVVRICAEDGEGQRGEPPADPHKVLERGRWEGSVTEELKNLERDVNEIKGKVEVLTNKVEVLAKDVGELKSDLKIGFAALFFVQVLTLLSIADALRLCNPL